MINGKKILAIIPARGGSKGIPRKNIKILGGKPLIAWTIKEAKKSKYIDRLILSSDDEEIIHVAKNLGCEVPFVRPIELSQDETPGIEPVLHAIKTLNEYYDYVCLLQPTSPLRKVEDIDGCIEKCFSMNSKSCVSVTEVDKHPYWMYEIKADEKLHPLFSYGQNVKRRQDLPKVYLLNGSVYFSDVNELYKNKTFLTKDTASYIMDRAQSIDVDNIIDFNLVQMIINNNLNEHNKNH